MLGLKFLIVKQYVFGGEIGAVIRSESDPLFVTSVIFIRSKVTAAMIGFQSLLSQIILDLQPKKRRSKKTLSKRISSFK
jgi:hypothetical protein